MTTYIGAPTSRIDGRTKVTGEARYAAEFTAPGLTYGSIVSATIAKGHMTSIDSRAALAVDGVIAVFTHENRPPLANTDQAYKDDVAPDGSPFRPLYDDRIMFNGQPIALVVAETPEAAQFAASLMQVKYKEEAHVTDIYQLRESALPVNAASNPTPPKTRGNPDQALTTAAVFVAS